MKLYLPVIALAIVALPAGAVARPLSYNVYDEVLNESLGSRPFFVSDSASCTSTATDQSTCRGAIQAALRSKKYRVIGSKNNVSDYNSIDCSVDMTKERKAKSTATVNLFGSIKNDKLQVDEGTVIGIELGVMVNCSISDAFTNELVYEGSGQATTFVSDKSKVYSYFSSAMKSAVKQAIGKMGKANSKKNKNFVYAEATGFDDGVKTTAARDLQEAIASAKVIAVEQVSSRVRKVSKTSKKYETDSKNGENLSVGYNSDSSFVVDGSIVAFNIIEDYGYVNNRYKVKIGVRIVRN